MKNKVKAVLVALMVAGGGLVFAPPASAHYDPWTTHWHYSNGVRTYKMCSVWDQMWGCKHGYP